MSNQPVQEASPKTCNGILKANVGSTGKNKTLML